METSVITHPRSSDARTGEPSQPIANYGLLADCNSAALVDSDGSIDWLCLPRYDSDAVFARLLDPDAGHWSIRPTQSYTATRRYLPGTLVIETVFKTETGEVRLTDAMAFAEGQRGHDLGYDAPHELLRSVEGISGEVELRLELAPRPQYGLIMPLVRLEDGGARTFGAGRLGIRSAVPLEVEDSTMSATFKVGEGEQLGFSMRWEPPESQHAPQPTEADRVATRVDDTVEAWRSWEAEHDIYEGPHRDLVRTSSRVLKGLTYRPTGAIVAAPTTSLPETVGGERNWDYRFSWIRDSSLTIEALYIGACSDEAEDFVSFMTSSAGGWHETDQGMWEMRGEPRHHLSSKVLCWTALDRAVRLAPQLGEHAKVEEWTAARDAIREAILTRGWSEKRQAFAQSVDSDELDAAVLLMPIYGFLPATDPRMRSTIEAVARDLTEDGLVLRYRNREGVNADGLSGEEGTFVICSFWLVDCLAKAGEVERAEALYEQLAGYANDLGLLAEEIETATGEQLGNFPQAYSHIGLITAGYEIDKAKGY